MISPNNISLVQGSWRQLQPKAQNVGEQFYQKLFYRTPSIKPMFRSELHAEANKFMVMLNYIIKNLNDLDSIKMELSRLAEKHEEYGVKPDDYPIMGGCLIAALKTGLKGNWDPAVKHAWEEMFKSLSDKMLDYRQQFREREVLA